MDRDHQFKLLLLGISNRLSKEELEVMKFGVSLPKGKIQNIQKPFELFSLMMEGGEPRLSADNLNPLVKLLEFAGRKDLIVELEGSRETGHAQLPSLSQHLEGNDTREWQTPPDTTRSIKRPQENGRGVPETSWFNERPCYAGALPCKPAYFYGRNKQLDEIVDVLRSNNGKRLVHITGLPGYGKSCLAQKIGHVMTTDYGFKVIFLCLREIKCVSKMCANILIALKANVCHSLARKQRELALKLLSETSKTVLILDNAEDIVGQPEEGEEFYSFVNQVAKFARDVKCVITSRVLCPASCQISRLSVRLLELDNDHAAKLLQDKVKESSMMILNDDDAKIIADLCLNIPLILHAAAAYMENLCGPETLISILRKHMTPVAMANMEELSPDLRMKNFLFDCLQQLDPELEKALVSLAVFPAAFRLEQVPIVFGLQQSKLQLNRTLLHLMKRSLVHRDLESEQYFVHRVIQLCCEEKAQKEERLRFSYNQAKESFVNHYLALITELHKRFLCKHTLRESLCSYWEEEQHMIQAILWATEIDEKVAARCTQVLNDAVVFLAKVMKKRDFEAVYKVLLQANRTDPRLLADCLTCVGIKLIYSCECHRACSVVSEESYQVLKKASQMYEQLGVTEGDLVAQCYSKLARCMVKNGGPTTALELSGKALQIREKAKEKEPFKYAGCCNDRAVVLSALNSHEEALSLRECALVVYVEHLDDHPFTGTLCNYLANDCLVLGNFDKAVEYFSKALSIRKSFLGDCHQETARTLHDLGVAYKMKKEYENAINHLEAAIKIQEALFDVPHEKLKSLQEELEICVQLNAPEDKIKGLQQKIQGCKTEMTQAKKSNNIRLEQMMDIVNNNNTC